MNHEDGPAIKCDICEEWSHIACQQEGRASNLPARAKFICDFCSLEDIMPSKQLQRASEQWYDLTPVICIQQKKAYAIWQ